MPHKTLDPGTCSRLDNGVGNKMAAAPNSYSAGELARLAGVSTDTLRYYERQQLLPAPPRAANHYRRYPMEALSRVRVIRSALAVGFSVEELARIIRARDRGQAPCQHVRQLAADKLRALEIRIRELQQLRRALSATLNSWDQQLAKTPSGARAGLLDSLVKAQPSTALPLSPLLAPALRRTLARRRNQSGEQS